MQRPGRRTRRALIALVVVALLLATAGYLSVSSTPNDTDRPLDYELVQPVSWSGVAATAIVDDQDAGGQRSVLFMVEYFGISSYQDIVPQVTLDDETVELPFEVYYTDPLLNTTTFSFVLPLATSSEHRVTIARHPGATTVQLPVVKFVIQPSFLGGTRQVKSTSVAIADVNDEGQLFIGSNLELVSESDTSLQRVDVNNTTYLVIPAPVNDRHLVSLPVGTEVHSQTVFGDDLEININING